MSLPLIPPDPVLSFLRYRRFHLLSHTLQRSNTEAKRPGGHGSAVRVTTDLEEWNGRGMRSHESTEAVLTGTSVCTANGYAKSSY
jgi:hypothetical protein